MKRISWLLFLAALVTYSCGVRSSHAQDTLQARVLSATLPDSTLFRYIGGPILLVRGGATRFLHFNSTVGSLPTGYIRSESFASEGTGDVIWISRVLAIDDHDVKVNKDTTLSSAQKDSLALAWYNSRLSKQVSSSNTYFDSTSSISYILGVYDASADTLMKAIDTLRCYVNAQGQFRYKNLFPSFNWRKFRLPASTSGTIIYLAATVESNLPTGSSLSYGYEDLDKEGYPDTTKAFSINYQEGLPTASPKPANPIIQQAGAAVPQIIFEYRREAYPVLRLGPCSAPVELSLADASGKEVWKDELPASSGWTVYDLTSTNLPQGAYFVTIEANGRRETKPVIFTR